MRFKFFTIFCFIPVIISSCYKDDIESLQKQINELTGTRIATINDQISNISSTIDELTNTETALSNYISSLQADNKTFEVSISDLKIADANLNNSISGLKEYTNTSLKNNKGWIEATFATLAQYDTLCTVIANLSSTIGTISSAIGDAKTEIVAGYEKAIQESIEKSEDSMKKWVNEVFANYYTIAQVNATLDSLGKKQSSKDSSFASEIAAQKIALDTAKSQLTIAYQAAITTSINSLQGEINNKIATEISKALSTLNGQISTIQGEINSIHSRLATIENQIDSLINMIQSIAVIPSYDDGSVKCKLSKVSTDTIFTSTLSCYIHPLNAAEALVAKWNNETDSMKRAALISLKLVTVQTKGDAELSATVDSVYMAEDTCKIRVLFPEHINSSLFDKYMASLVINTGLTNISSKYFSFYYGSCFAAGTLITMADGSKKRIEDITLDDRIRTFDHEAGSLSSEGLYYIYKSIVKSNSFTLTFDSGATLEIVDCHDLLEKESRKYVTISQNKADSFVGKSFYNAELGIWDKLTKVTINNTPVEYYSIYSSYHINCIANGFLTVPDDVDYTLNIYELDENLKADAEQLAADIAKYGLTDPATFPEFADVIDVLEKANIKYCKIAIGKGLITWEALWNLFNDSTN